MTAEESLKRYREWVGRLETEARGYEDYERWLVYKLNKIESILIQANKKLDYFLERALNGDLGECETASFKDIVETQQLLTEAIALKNKHT